MARARPDLPRPGPPRRLTRGRRARILATAIMRIGASRDRVVCVEPRPARPAEGVPKGCDSVSERPYRDRADWRWSTIPEAPRGPSTGRSAHPRRRRARATCCAWLHPWSRACASPPPGPGPPAELAASWSRAWSRASASGRSSGASRPSWASPAGSATPPAGWRSRRPGDRRSLDAFVRRLRTDAPPRARVERVTVDAAARGGGRRPAPARSPSTRASAPRRPSASSRPTSPPATTACARSSTRPTGATATRSRTARTAGRAPRSSTSCPYDRAQTTMRAVPPLPRLRRGVRRPGEPALPRGARGLPRLRAAARLPAHRRARADRHGEDAALAAAVADLVAGRIVAVKGLGGYHLACDATDEAAVQPPARPQAPLGQAVRGHGPATSRPSERSCRVGATERALLAGPARPIVLLVARRRGEPRLAPSVAAGNHRLGVFLPVHAAPPPAARGRRPAARPDLRQPHRRAAGDRRRRRRRPPGRPRRRVPRPRPRDPGPLRRLGRPRGRRTRVASCAAARGYAPEALPLPVAATPVRSSPSARSSSTRSPSPAARRAHVAPHNGDLEDLATHRAFTDGLAHLSRLLALEPEVVVHDLHPEYLSTKYAVARFPAARRIAVQHHHAHVASCAAEHGITGPVPRRRLRRPGDGRRRDVLGRRDPRSRTCAAYRRLARFGRAPMPGGALAVKRPTGWRSGYLLAAEAVAATRGRRRRGAARRGLATPTWPRPSWPASTRARSAVLRTQVARRLNAPVASSAGRLFDAAAALLGLRDVAEYEAQAAIDLEIAAGDRAAPRPAVRALARVDGLLVYDPRPTLRGAPRGRGRRPGRRRRSRRRSTRRSPRSPGSSSAARGRRDRAAYRVPLGRRLPEPPPRVDAAAPARPATASRSSSTARSPSTTAG